MIEYYQPTSDYLTYHREIDITKPESFQPELKDIFRALPKINRFNGHTIKPYSVATHSLMCVKVAKDVHNMTEPHLLLAVLLHDAAEVYIGDIVRPVKRVFGKKLTKLEAEILHRILVITGLSVIEMAEIYTKEFQRTLNEIDNRMVATEADLLRDSSQQNTVLGYLKRYDIRLPLTLSWQEIEAFYVDAFKTLLIQIKQRRLDENSPATCKDEAV
jgi:5'-deoxynucleotidase YfbR-like HD superfamily hydrolase